MANTDEDNYGDFTTNRGTTSLKTIPEPLYGNTQEQQVVYGNIACNSENNKQTEDHYMSYHKDVDRNEDVDDYMDLVVTTKHSNQKNNAMEENHYGNIITEDPLYGNLTPKPNGHMG